MSSKVMKDIQHEDKNYDTHVRELALDKRAKPKDRTKTEEELAVEAKEALEKAERRRQKRMRGESDSESEDEGLSRRKARRKAGGDDLEDDFADDGGNWAGLGAGLGGSNEEEEPRPTAVNEDEIQESDDAIETEDDDESDGNDDEEEEEEEDDSGGDEDEDSGSEEDADDLSPRPARSIDKGKAKATGDLPFTFPCPSALDEFLDIVDELEIKDVPTVVQRIRTLYHPSLDNDNKFKLQVRSTLSC